MSLILDALKKSEKQRQQNADAASGATVPQAAGAAETPSRWRIAAGVLAFSVAGLAVGGSIGYFGLVPGPKAPVAIAPTAATATLAPVAPRPATTAAPLRPRQPEIPSPPAADVAEQSAARTPTTPAPSAKAPEPASAASAPPAPIASPALSSASAAAVPPTPSAPAAAAAKTPTPSVATVAAAQSAPAEAPGRLVGVAVPKKPAPPFAARASPRGGGEAQALVRRGRGYEDKAHYEQAIDAYSQAIVLDPGFADAYFGRGWALLATGAYGHAAGDFQRMIALRPDAADAYFGRAWALEQQGDREQAIRQYGEAIRLQPDHADAHFSRGVLEFMAGRMEAAARDFAAVHGRATGRLKDYALLWRYVSEARGGIIAPTVVFDDWRADDPWPGVLAKLFRGQATADQVLVAANNRDAARQRENECIAFFFLAQHRLIAGDAKGAADYFRRTLATGVTHFRQYAAARAELDRLDKAN